jgi:hypothetical protein
MSDDFSADEDDDDDDEEYSGARRRSTDRRGGASSSAAGRSRRKGAGNPGKPGVRLTLADLQSQFGVGLKEAAARLGICPTTLKRACRRHGIQRWPRRQLQKVNRALDELEARQMLQPHQHLLGTGAAAAAAAGGGFAPGAGPGADGVGGVSDNRWTTLAHFMPAYQSTADTMQGYAVRPGCAWTAWRSHQVARRSMGATSSRAAESLAVRRTHAAMCIGGPAAPPTCLATPPTCLTVLPSFLQPRARRTASSLAATCFPSL